MLLEHDNHIPRIHKTAYVAPNATVCGEVKIGAHSRVLFGAEIGKNSVVRINGVVHINTGLPAESSVPIGWVAIGDPAEILPPDAHERILQLLGEQNFSKSVFRLKPAAPGKPQMQVLTELYAKALGKYPDNF